MTHRSVMSRSKQNLLSNMSVILRTHDLSVTDSVSPWEEKRNIKYIKTIQKAVVLIAQCVHTHVLATRPVVKGHHVQDLLLFDEGAVAFDPTGAEGRRPWRSTAQMCEANIQHYLHLNGPVLLPQWGGMGGIHRVDDGSEWELKWFSFTLFQQ